MYIYIYIYTYTHTYMYMCIHICMCVYIQNNTCWSKYPINDLPYCLSSHITSYIYTPIDNGNRPI